MSHRKDKAQTQHNRQEDDDDKSSLEKQRQQQQQQKVEEALDETKDNIKRTADAATKEVPRYTKAFNDYQEQSIQTARDIATSYIETQKELLRSFQDSLEPAINNTIDKFRNNYRNYYSSAYSSSYPWQYPRNVADTYGMIVNSLTDNTMATVRLTNNMIFANLEAFKTSMAQIGENAKEISKINIDTAKTVQRASKVTAHEEE
jgi:hypothetical protein